MALYRLSIDLQNWITRIAPHLWELVNTTRQEKLQLEMELSVARKNIERL
jgi:hypothetical protein